ncbi:hypothetical protein PV797_14845 [Clostridiaceae bacterium M8S5]|nr:hypothetical protein PV797_14845 [Clostridiaceae bacterium M8S5]
MEVILIKTSTKKILRTLPFIFVSIIVIFIYHMYSTYYSLESIYKNNAIIVISQSLDQSNKSVTLDLNDSKKFVSLLKIDDWKKIKHKTDEVPKLYFHAKNHGNTDLGILDNGILKYKDNKYFQMPIDSYNELMKFLNTLNKL